MQNSKLQFKIQNYNLENKEPEKRMLYDLKDVLMDQEWLKTSPDFEAYYMYRKVKEENGLKNSITVITGKMLGSEFMKTKGHEHLTHQEIYTVLEGRGLFLIQKTKGDVVEDVYVVEAKEGESIIIPRYYGHVTINPSDKNLTMADWVAQNCRNDYSLFEKMQGACYYYILRRDSSSGQARSTSSGQARSTSSGQARSTSSGQAGWVKNENYKNVPELRFEKPLKEIPKDLSFLKK